MSVPKGWIAGVVGDVVISAQYGTSKAKSATGTRPIVGMRNIDDGVVTLNNLNHVAEEEVDWESLTLQKGDVLLNRTNSPDLVGKVGIVREDTDAVFASYLVRLIPDLNLVVPEYLNYWLNSTMVQGQLRMLATRGVSQANINPSTFRKHCTFLRPPILEQRKISEILGAWDDAIERSLALRLSLERRRDWLRRSVLTGTTRLSGYCSVWSTARLGEILTEHGRKSTKEQEVYSVSVHKGLVNQIEHLGRSFASKETSQYNLVRPGDLVYTKSPTGEFPLGIVKQSRARQDVIVSPLYAVFTPSTEHLGVILDALFESPIYARNYLNPLVQKGAKNTLAITNQKFLEGLVNYPNDPAEQSAIAAVVEASFSEIISLNRSIAALRTQKRGLMQKLLTGEVRVNLEMDQVS